MYFDDTLKYKEHKENVLKPAFTYRGYTFVFESEEEREAFVQSSTQDDLNFLITGTPTSTVHKLVKGKK